MPGWIETGSMHITLYEVVIWELCPSHSSVWIKIYKNPAEFWIWCRISTEDVLESVLLFLCPYFQLLFWLHPHLSLSHSHLSRNLSLTEFVHKIKLSSPVPTKISLLKYTTFSEWALKIGKLLNLHRRCRYTPNDDNILAGAWRRRSRESCKGYQGSVWSHTPKFSSLCSPPVLSNEMWEVNKKPFKEIFS
jgi:hypothetical protein